MYHKIILEDMLRVVASLDANGRSSDELRDCIGRMCDCLYSFEHNANRTPLFNDSGDNVAKSKNALLACAKKCFGVEPEYREDFPDAGYYLMEHEYQGHIIKLIFDAGDPGPKYALGHAHCDALSFEAFVDGEPWIVNCGTYAYQDPLRLDFKRTASHSTVMVDGCEQSECWASFRVAKNAVAILVAREDGTIRASMADAQGQKASRSVSLDNSFLRIVDETTDGVDLKCFWHFALGGPPSIDGRSRAKTKSFTSKYSPDFGCVVETGSCSFEGAGAVTSLWLVPTPITFLKEES